MKEGIANRAEFLKKTFSSFYSNGKLLLTGEYVVLDGALSLALPTKYGQSLTVRKIEAPKLVWNSFDEKDTVWFTGTFELKHIQHSPEHLPFSIAPLHDTVTSEGDVKIKDTLLKILREAIKLNPFFLSTNTGFEVSTKLTFSKDWGLGSSSTLINNIAQWAEVDAYELLWNAFSGSGYDIACAQHNWAITYRVSNKNPVVEKVGFHPPFVEQLYFVFLNKKQNSREGIAHYGSFSNDKSNIVKEISSITEQMINCKSITIFEKLIERHENLISSVIQLPKIKDQLFPDYFGSIKSLGAWGGDFVMATGNENTPYYFKQKGFKTVIPYKDMILPMHP